MTDWLRERYSDVERPACDAAYLRNLHPAISAIQSQIEADAGREKEPITDRASARFLAMLVRVSGARQALEIGTNLGYSASWIAGALPADGRLTCIDVSAELLERARASWDRGQVGDRIQTHCGRALEILPHLSGPYDFAYIDANKEDYQGYLDAVIKLLRVGGVVAVDNLLWGGQAARDPDDLSQLRDTTPLIRAFNRAFLDDPRLDSTIVQVGDGVGVGVTRSRG